MIDIIWLNLTFLSVMTMKSNKSVSSSSSDLGLNVIYNVIHVNISLHRQIIKKKQMIAIYKGVSFGCNQCQNKATQPCNLRKHIMGIHKGYDL